MQLDRVARRAGKCLQGGKTVPGQSELECIYRLMQTAAVCLWGRGRAEATASEAGEPTERPSLEAKKKLHTHCQADP
jgi:hypothetical protein